MKRALMIIIVLFLTCCKKEDLIIKSEINGNFLAKLERKNAPGKRIIISSGGGSTKVAFEAARNIIRNENTVIVQGVCLSACAEDILPSAKTIKFLDNPMIGFHWNSFMNRSQFIRYGGDVTYCSSVSIDNQKYLYGLAQLNQDFWKETEKRLVLEHYEIFPVTGACPLKIRRFKNYMWLPTSKQLKKLWGLEFSGRVCSDNIRACVRKVDRRWEKGTRIVIGDKVYISKGW